MAALSIDQLPAPVQPVSPADVLPVVQTETGGATPGSKITVQVALSTILGQFGTNGPGFTSVAVNGQGHMIVTKTDGSTVDLGVARGTDGKTVTAVDFDSRNHFIFTLNDGSTVDAGSLPSVDMTSILGGPMDDTANFYGNNSTVDGSWTAPLAAQYMRSKLQPRRSVSAITDTPSVTDDRGIIAYTSSAAVTATLNDLGFGVSYQIVQQGIGQVTATAGANVTLASDHASPTYKTAAQWAVLLVICTGTGVVSVTGKMA
jgi:hypothetical protein